jgi:Zn-dependent metalloprotease
MRHGSQLIALASLTAILALPAAAVDRWAPTRPVAVDELAAQTALVAMDPATGAPRLVRIPPGSLQLEGADSKSRAMSFFERFRDAFGLEDPTADLELVKSTEDELGMTHLSFAQIYEGVPVFGARVVAHFDRNGELVTVNGALVPNLELDPSPILGATDAAAIARAVVAKNRGRRADELEIVTPVFWVYRTGLARGIPGANHLAWEIEVGDLSSVREFVFVDAHDGRILDRISGIHEITRNISHEVFSNQIWTEGDALPYSGLSPAQDTEVNDLIAVTGETYDLFSNITSGAYLSYDGNDRTMTSIYEDDAIDNCPNANWNGRTTNFCNGLAVDDVIAHEWTHAYTDFTHNLIYQWQPGALNESYSDIFGEIVDRLNGRGQDEPGAVRIDGGCSIFGGQLNPTLTIASPPEVAGGYAFGEATFNPLPPWSSTAQVELVNDGVADDDNTLSDACDPPLVGFTPGRIALIDRGECSFRDKVVAAEDAGASGVIIANNQGDGLVTMGSDDPGRLTIPALFIGQSDGEALKLVLDQGVQATLSQGGVASDPSASWLVAEDSSGGAFRDMWNPNCFADPGRVSDPIYFCREDDNGGVHINSGIPNHAFALLVDGGAYNGRTVAPIGMTRAAHIYWRAMSVGYQTPTSKFADHADALEISCADLIGESITDLETGETFPNVINAGHCAQVAEAMLAVEMREDPVQCGFESVLDPNPPPVQPTDVLYSVTFNSDPGSSWTVSNEGVFEEFDIHRNW